MSARRRRAPLSETAPAAASTVTDPDLVALVGKQSTPILELLQRARDQNRGMYGAPSPDSDLYGPEEGSS